MRVNGQVFWRCPNCHLPLLESHSGLSCENNHSFDRAKQGYFNLLLANQKNSKEPGDNAEMIDARRLFLESNVYQPLFDAIHTQFQTYLSQHAQANVLDIGCGEGYYLDQSLAQSEGAIHAYGIDIAKVACKRAAGRYKCHEFAVASSFNLPVLDRVVDIALNVFAPFDEQELARVLRSEGKFIRVTPGSQHLWQIKSAFYDNPTPHSKASPLTGFSCVHSQAIDFDYCFKHRDHLESLLKMTPLNWSGSQEKRAALLESLPLVVSCSFIVDVFQVTEDR